MNETDVTARLESLEIRYSHQEHALEELTRSLLEQESLLKRQGEMIERLEQALKTLESGTSKGIVDERPPHY